MHEEYRETSQAALIKAGLDMMHPSGECYEVRIPGGRGRTISGYFDDSMKAAIQIAKENKKWPGIYVTANPVNPALLARNSNKFEYGATVTTSDHEIKSRQWFLLDLDPVRPAGVSSSDTELELTVQLADTITGWLDSLGWPEPFVALSGNGIHVMYRVDEPNDASAKVDFEFATKMISSIFSTPEVLVDTTSFNAARIWKIYGTLSAKGSSTNERPHRVAKILRVPQEVKLLHRDKISQVAAPLRDAKTDEFHDAAGEYIQDMTKWLMDRGCTVSSGPRPIFGNEGQKWLISHCPFNPQHTNPMVALVGGRPVYRCLHNSCSTFRWKEFREKVDPTYKDPVTVRRRIVEWCNSDAEAPDGELLQAAATLKKFPALLMDIRKEVNRGRLALVEEGVKAEKRRFIKETIGENNEKGNLVGVINRVKKMQAEGLCPIFWISEFDHRIRVGSVGDVDCPVLMDDDEIKTLVMFHSGGDTWVKQLHVSQAIRFIANERIVNPLKIYLKNLRWDGIKRIDTWLPDFMGTKDDQYTRVIGRKWLISGVARAMNPGCQADYMLIFEGSQGIGKSKALRALGGQFYIEYSGGIKADNGQKDMVAVISGKMIVELSELAAIRRSDMETLKAMLTKTVDEARLAYERNPRQYPRTCIFGGTTNEFNKAYIADPSGARRFWPTYCGEVSPVRPDALKECAAQLWAEATEAYEDGEDWWSIPTDLVQIEQSARQISVEDTDPWYSKIRGALTDPNTYSAQIFVPLPKYVNGKKTDDLVVRAGPNYIVLGSLLGIEAARQTQADVMRLRNVLMALGFMKVRPSKPWYGSLSAYDMDKSSKGVGHIWPVIEGAMKAMPFPATEGQT